MDAVAHFFSGHDAAPVEQRAPSHLGVRLAAEGASVAVYSRHADAIWFCLFDERGEREVARWRLGGRDGDVFHGFVPGVAAGARYGLRAEGPWEPSRGHRFDPLKLLADPYATRIDRPFRWSAELAFAREHAVDTAPFTPRCVVESEAPAAPRRPGSRKAPRLIYELPVRAFTALREDVAPRLRGTLGGLMQPGCIDHLVKLGVSHVELMPITAWMDEPHLERLGLSNAWGYNPASFFALDPRLARGGMEELCLAVARLHEAGIAVLLDVVFNHTAESDLEGPTLSLRGLDNATYYLHSNDSPGVLVNDTGCGNTLACNRPAGVRLVMDSMRYFVERAGVDGFRFDLAPVLGRSETGFSPHAPLLAAISQDPALRDLMLIAEPWDIGPGGYQMGAFPAPFMEWNDRFRDDVRRFWRGEFGAIGAFATRVAGSRDIFARSHRPPSASVNFAAAHDGFTLRDVVTYSHKHNEANGEQNRDGSSVNHSWNHGVEGPGDDAVEQLRDRDVRALLATTILSLGAPMITAGDEFGRTQQGNNNAYCQDNAVTWLDWARADAGLIEFTAALVRLRARLRVLCADEPLRGAGEGGAQPGAVWLRLDGTPKQQSDWTDGDCLVLLSAADDGGRMQRAIVAFNRANAPHALMLPQTRPGLRWMCALDSATGVCSVDTPAVHTLNARSVCVLVETH
ncbi:MAG: glycogen debranching protein GlgX [Beijerinckiaceae bacterium]